MATASSPTDTDKYRMLSIPRGICVIINNRKFTVDRSHPRSQELKYRDGSEHDVVALARTFTKLQFLIKYYEDQTDTQMASIMKEAADDPAQTNYDIFVCCIMSHGSLGQVYGSNGVPVDIKDLTYCVKPVYCPRLTGKPKLFFIQACQGSARQRGYSANQTDEEDDAIPSEEELIPNDSDFLLSYSTVPGNVSWRDPDKGSRYIRHLTNCLDQLANREEIVHLHYEVNDRVAKEGKVNKQTASMFVTLRKKLFLATKEITDRGTDERPKRHDFKNGVTMMFDPLKATASSGVTIETHIQSESKSPNITCIAVGPSSEHLYMADNNNAAIKVFSRNPDRLLSTLTLDVKPWCMAVVSYSLLALTSDNKGVLVLIDVFNKLRPRVKSTVETKRQYLGVCVMTSNSDDTTLVVSCVRHAASPSSVDVITLTGEVIRTIITSQTLPDLTTPWYLQVDTQRDVLYISDFARHCVWFVELTTGRVLQTLKNPQMSRPRQVCTDSAGNLYVASDGGQCVLVKSVGDVWRVLLSGTDHGEGTYVYPVGSCVTDTSLVVSWRSGTDTVVKKYDLV